MIQIEQLAQMLQDELDGNIHAAAGGLKFKVHPTMGNYKNAVKKLNGTTQKYINAVLRQTSGEYTPIKDINNLTANLTLELAVPQEKVDQVELILSTWSEAVIGEIYNLGDWVLLITPTPATAGQVKNATPIGSMISELVVLNIQFIKDGLIGNAVDWTINGSPIKVLNAVLSSSRTPDVIPDVNTGTCKANNQYENTTIAITFAYSFTTATQTLVNDLINKNKDAIYTITRNDGFANSFEEDCICTKIDLTEEAGKIVSISCAFAKADTELYEEE